MTCIRVVNGLNGALEIIRSNLRRMFDKNIFVSSSTSEREAIVNSAYFLIILCGLGLRNFGDHT